MGWFSKNAESKFVSIVARKRTLLILTAILVLAALLRLSYVRIMNPFGHDSALQCMAVREMIAHHDFPLLGIGVLGTESHLGPAWYYILSVPFLISPEPEAGSVFVGLLNVLAVFFCFKLGEELFNRRVGLIASALYAVSPSAVEYSNAIWNPDVLPLFATLIFYSTSKLIKGESRYLPVIFASLAVALQLHMGTVVLIPALLLLLLMFKPKMRLKHLVLGLILFVFVFAPFIYFEFTHEFRNVRHLLPLASSARESTTVKGPRWELLRAVMDMTCGSWMWYSDRGLWYGIGEPYEVEGSVPFLERFGSPSPDMSGWHLLAYWVNYVELALFFSSLLLLLFFRPSRRARSAKVLLWLLFVPLLILNHVYNFDANKLLNEGWKLLGGLPYHYILFLYPLPFLSIALLVDWLQGRRRRISLSWRGRPLQIFKGKPLFRFLVLSLMVLIVATQAFECVTIFSKKPTLDRAPHGPWYPWSTLEDKEEAVDWIIKDSGGDFVVTYVVRSPLSYKYLFAIRGATPNDSSTNSYVIVDPFPTVDQWGGQWRTLIDQSTRMQEVGPIRIYFARY